ncbi:MAG: amidohydrolase family protein [Acetobacteraceae bacterium]
MTEPYVYRGAIYRDNAALRTWLARAEPEEVLDPDLPIVDPHHHLWETPQRGRYLLHEFLDDLAAGHNIVKTMFLECEAMYRADGPEALRPVGEVEFVRGMAAMSASGQYGPTRIAAGMVGFAELTHGASIRDALEAEVAAGAGLLRGMRYCMPWDEHEEVVKHVARYVPPGRLLDPIFRAGAAQLAALGLSFDVWLYFTQLPELVAFAQAFPDLTIILNHVGGPIGIGPYAGHRSEVQETWRRHIAALARCPNVRVKLGGLGMLHFGFDFHLRETPPGSAELVAAWRPYMETCIEAFGARRAMFESNFPPDKQSCTYLALWNAFKRIASGASAEEKAALFTGTASEVYRL